MTGFLIFAALVIVAINSYYIVPPNHYVVLYFMGRRWRTGDEGFNLKWPFLEWGRLVSTLLDTIPFKGELTAKDGVNLQFGGDVQFRPDRNVADREGREVFSSNSEDVMKTGIANEAVSRIAALGAMYDAEDFKNHRDELVELLNSEFRLPRSPHLEAGCAGEQALDWYRANQRQVRRELEDEHQTPDISPVEQRYGLDIIAVTLPILDFTDQTQEALEDQKQAQLREGAFGTRMKMVQEAMAAGATFQEANNAVDATLKEGVSKHVVSVEGRSGDAAVLGALVGGLGKRDPQQPPAPQGAQRTKRRRT